MSQQKPRPSATPNPPEVESPAPPATLATAMNRLQSELRRLYLPHPAVDLDVDASAADLIDAEGRVRAMVFEMARPANWDALSKVWRGVQVDLELPAPAIAVSGTDGFQLWFSLAEPVSVAQAHAFLALLRAHFLADIAVGRVGLLPAVDASSPHHAHHAAWVPAEQGQSGNWSAFVAPDLAPVFADTPWLDIPPSHDGQADVLSRLDSIKPAAFEAALERLRPATPSGAGAMTPEPTSTDAVSSVGSLNAKRFLLQVMNDDTVPLALRIEAAKALLPYADPSPDRP